MTPKNIERWIFKYTPVKEINVTENTPRWKDPGTPDSHSGNSPPFDGEAGEG